MFLSPTFFGPKVVSSHFFPASLKYFHLWIFGTEKKTKLALVAHFLQPCHDPSKITPNWGGDVGDLRTLRRIRGIEVWKLRDDWLWMDISRKKLAHLGESSRSWIFCWEYQKGILAMDLDTSIDSWCFAVLNGVFLRNPVLKYTTIHEFNELPTDQTI